MEYNQELGKGHHPVLCWGHKELPKQSGQVTYKLANNRVDPLRHFWNEGAVARTIRRTSGQILYVLPPLLAAYVLMEWANARNHYLNSKAGRKEYGEEGGG